MPIFHGNAKIASNLPIISQFREFAIHCKQISYFSRFTNSHCNTKEKLSDTVGIKISCCSIFLLVGLKATHTEKKKIKIGQPRSKIQAKKYPKTHLNTLKFSKKKFMWGGGGGGPKGPQGGNTLFIKVIKSRKWKKKARNIIVFRCSKALYFHTFSKMFLSKFTLKNMYNTPQICSGMLKIAHKALHFPKPPPPPPLRTFPAASRPIYY